VIDLRFSKTDREGAGPESRDPICNTTDDLSGPRAAPLQPHILPWPPASHHVHVSIPVSRTRTRVCLPTERKPMQPCKSSLVPQALSIEELIQKAKTFVAAAKAAELGI
jgi:hypothetical protein